MSGPALGIGRITVPYTISALTHESRMYVTNPTLSGSDWVIDRRPSVGGTVNWEDAAQDYADAISYLMPAGVGAGTALLEELSSTGWLLRATVAVTLPNASAGVNVATQVTLTLRDTNFTRPKIVVMEGNEPAPQKITAPAGGSATFDSFVAEFLSTGSGAARPYVVMVNQHEFFLAENPFVSAVITLNRKLRRARGVG